MRVFLLLALLGLAGCSTELVPVGEPEGGGAIDLPGAKPNGGMEGGGGRSVVCRDKDRNITSATVLDVFEAPSHGFELDEFGEMTTKEIYESVLEKIPKNSRSTITVGASLFQKNKIRIPRNSRLKLIDDSLEVVLPKNCEVEQAVIFEANNNVKIDGEIWDALSPVNKAALIVHEGLYWMNRAYGSKDSRTTRLEVGRIFSKASVYKDRMAGVPEDSLFCSDYRGTVFYAYKESNHWVMQFIALGASAVLSKTSNVVLSKGFDFNEVNYTNSKFLQDGEGNIGVQDGMEFGSILKGHTSVGSMAIKKRWTAVRTVRGENIPGKQMIRYSIAWQSDYFSDIKTTDTDISCMPRP